MIRSFILFLSVFVVACNNMPEDSESPNQIMEINVNDQAIKVSAGKISGNENCNYIFISASTDKMRVKFVLTKEGFIKDVLLVDYSANDHYQAADFKPSETFGIQNFLYDEDTKLLTFDFSGVLYDVSNESSTVSIDGKINFKTLKTVDCSFEPWLMSASLNDNYFSCPAIFGKANSDKTEWIGLSDNGIKLTITTTDALKDMAVGTYSFTQEDILNVISIENYIGANKASSNKTLNSNEWERYQCEGQLIIVEHVGGAKPHTKGMFAIKAFKDGELVYEVTNGEFSI